MRFLPGLILLLFCAACAFATPLSSAQRVLSTRPRLVIWAWERPEDLSFIDPEKVEVAVLVQTVNIGAASIKVRKREQTLRLPPGVSTVAVTRVETDRRSGAPLTAEQLRQLATVIADSCRSARGVQIDFDAKVSERQFYRKLLSAVKERLPAGKLLSMTSLASWSFFDNWLGEDSPVDEVVPMFFSLGAGQLEVVDLLKHDHVLKEAYREAFGVSMGDLDTARVALSWSVKNQIDSRVYFFNPKPWTPKALAKALELSQPLIHTP